MNKTAIKNFAVWARTKLISDITYKAGLLGVGEHGIADPLPQSTLDLQFFDIGTKDYAQVAGADIKQRAALVDAIKDKEVAYTWFNRLIAIRFMEVNDYLPSRIRVLSSENPGKIEPDFVTTPFDTGMEFTAEEQDYIIQLKDDNKLDVLFRMLFIKQCNALHDILPDLFEETNDYTELLLNLSFTDQDGVVYHLTHDIAEDDFNVEKEGQVEIIGWMYQYYNSELKDETFALLKKNVKISKERIPAATQLFTPDWIVRYMVENSLGRLWVEGHPNEALKENWKYYLEEAEQYPEVQAQLEAMRAEYRNLNPEDIKVIDPCMGSGHILVYCFDVLMQIYESQGYTQREAAQLILEHNLFGLDIDKRAAQLAYFAVLMKARQYDRRILPRGIRPHVYAIEESNTINRAQLPYFGVGMRQVEKDAAIFQLTGLLDTFVDAKEYGSLLNVGNCDWELLKRFVDNMDHGQMSLDTVGLEQTQVQLQTLLKMARALAQQYEVVVTNPPYMGSSGMEPQFQKYISKYYISGKTDLFAAFIMRCKNMLTDNGILAMITMQSWMFLTSFQNIRELILSTNILNLIRIGYNSFPELNSQVAHACSFVIRNKTCFQYNAKYFELNTGCVTDDKNEVFLQQINKNDYFIRNNESFFKIQGAPIAITLTNKILEVFNTQPAISDIGITRLGMTTADNTRFTRFWYEPRIERCVFNALDDQEVVGLKKKWVPYNKGGKFRKWYGNLDVVVNWENSGYEIKNFSDSKGRIRSTVPNIEYYFRPCITWSKISTDTIAFRYRPQGSIFDVAGACIFSDRYLFQLLAFCNSKVAIKILNALSPTVNYEGGQIAILPIDSGVLDEISIKNISLENVNCSKEDWDSFETSWDFEEHPLVRISKYLWDATAVAASMHYYYNGHPEVSGSLELCYMLWQGECNERFNKLKANEEELNRIFIDIYGLQDELTPEVADKDVTVRKADLQRDIKSLISYAVGCMLGRYSLAEKGLAYAGGEWEASKYGAFVPDADNCLPITDEPYFEDDIVGRFVAWVSHVFGEDMLEANLDYIAKALGNKGATSREVIRNYFLKDFIKDHNKIYQKRPIYWLFDSGKQNGFKALVYMHRWNADTVGNMRVEYLHKMQRIYEQEMNRMQEIIDNSNHSGEIKNAIKRKEKLQKQLKETQDYDAKLAHIALSRIDIDLDDGVKVNHEKVQTAKDGKHMQILAKI